MVEQDLASTVEVVFLDSELCFRLFNGRSLSGSFVGS